MKYCLNSDERAVLKEFSLQKTPKVFKEDDTDFILFLEVCDFDVCNQLLRGKEITDTFYNWIIFGENNNYCSCWEDFKLWREQVRVDEDCEIYCHALEMVIDIFSKYYKQTRS